MKLRRQPTTQTSNFAQEDGYYNTRNKILRNFKWKIQGKWDLGTRLLKIEMEPNYQNIPKDT